MKQVTQAAYDAELARINGIYNAAKRHINDDYDRACAPIRSADCHNDRKASLIRSEAYIRATRIATNEKLRMESLANYTRSVKIV